MAWDLLTVSWNSASGVESLTQPPASLHGGDPVLDGRRRDGKAAVKFPLKKKVADTPAVGSAGGLFELGNDLHGSDFGSAAERASRKGGAHEVEGSLVAREASFNLGDDVHDMAVALDDHEVLHLHRTELANAPDVIARQIHEHDVFDPFFGIAEQF